MSYVKHNDFEIIDQIREGNIEALHLMFEKYSNFISKKIYRFNLHYDYDDIFQESLMLLHKSIYKFSDVHEKTFTRFFEMNLERRFISIVTKRRRRREIFSSNELFIYETNHNTTQSSAYYELYREEIAKILTKEEFLVYTLRELKNYSISFICQETGFKDKGVYNSLHRAKTKIKRHFNN